MAILDFIHINIRCPFCDITKEREIQTRQLSQEFRKYKVGDKIELNKYDDEDLRKRDFEFVTGYFSCEQDRCKDRLLQIKVKLKDLCVTGKYKIYLDSLLIHRDISYSKVWDEDILHEDQVEFKLLEISWN